MKKYFGDSILQSTIDELVLCFELDNLDKLKLIKFYVSSEAFEKAKEMFFEKEAKKSKSKKDSL